MKLQTDGLNGQVNLIYSLFTTHELDSQVNLIHLSRNRYDLAIQLNHGCLSHFSKFKTILLHFSDQRDFQ